MVGIWGWYADKRFLELFGEFVNTHIDGENDNCENFQDAEESEEEMINSK